MNETTYIIASARPWNQAMAANLAKKISGRFVHVANPNDLTVEKLRAHSPKMIFFPHWSWIVPAEIFSEFTCIVFHMTDLPFGRGGSPLQNLISRGIYETKISAIDMVKEVDGGDIYLKSPLSLQGSAEEIFMRASAVIEEMIVELIESKPVAKPQQGEVVTFARRKPAESSLQGCSDLVKVHDLIRMLDADGYPPAFLEVGDLRLEFSRSTLKVGEVQANVRITVKKNETNG